MNAENQPNDDSLDADLADLIAADDFAPDVDLADDDAEDPDETLQEHSEPEDETDGEPEEEPEGEEPEEEPEGEEEEPDQQDDSPAILSLKKRVDTLTARSKTAEERVAELENELEEAQASSSAPSTKTAFKNPREIEERELFLRQTIRGLSDMVAGEPARISDPTTGEMVDNTIEVDGKDYPVRHVRSRIHELEDEQTELPRAREALKVRSQPNAQARKLLPSAWVAGTPANTERLALIKETPELRGASEKVIIEAVVGRLALKQRESARRAAAKTSKLGKPLKSTSRVPARGKTHNQGGLSKQAVMDSMDVPDTEMADLAVALMDA